MSVDTMNKFFVGARGDRIAILGVISHDMSNLTHEDALNLAAWLVAIADPIGTRFEEILTAVKNT